MNNYTDLIGQKFGKLTILSVSDGKPIALCKCDCGVTKNIVWYSIKYGLTKSCGCYVKEYKDLTGRVYGDLIVLGRSDVYKNGNLTYLCKCKCGKEVICRVSGLSCGKTTHCGCKIKRVKYLNRALYEVWKGMKARCRDKNNISYKRYGGKGVKVCEEWENDFVLFYNWAMKNGWEKGLQVDKDIIGNGLLYSPEMCCIVTRTRNIREASFIKMSMEYADEVRNSTLSDRELGKLYKVSPSTISSIRRNKTWRQ